MTPLAAGPSTGVTFSATRFSATLREATQELHDAAERSPFVGRLLGGELGLGHYVRFLAQLHGVPPQHGRLRLAPGLTPERLRHRRRNVVMRWPRWRRMMTA